jgi:hypothetical protein
VHNSSFSADVCYSRAVLPTSLVLQVVGLLAMVTGAVIVFGPAGGLAVVGWAVYRAGEELESGPPQPSRQPR